jgi:hypothetical protein
MLDDTLDENHYIISSNRGNDAVNMLSTNCVTSQYHNNRSRHVYGKKSHRIHTRAKGSHEILEERNQVHYIRFKPINSTLFILITKTMYRCKLPFSTLLFWTTYIVMYASRLQLLKINGISLTFMMTIYN